LLGVLAAGAGAIASAAELPTDDRDALVQLWSGMYDMSEELVASDADESPLAPLLETQRVQINVRRILLPWLGSHVLYVEEFPYDQPFEARRRVLLTVEPKAEEAGALRVRQFTRKAEVVNPASLSAEDVESVPGCDLYLTRAGSQFRGGTRGRKCLETSGEPRWLDYRVVIGEGLFWYRTRRLTVADDELSEEIAGFPHVDLDEARLFSCGITYQAKNQRRKLEGVDLHDRGGRVRFRTPEGRELLLELHGRDWPLSEGRESLVLILSDPKVDEPIGSSWTSLGAARVGIDVGWLAIDCAPVVSETGEQRS
jgi:CpeT/CpcT family (DUF1001)